MITFLKSAVYTKDYPDTNLKELVIVGRSNVGKSSFINALYNHNISKVGKTPGKTRLLNFFQVDSSYTLVDVPGYGFAKLSAQKIIEFGAMMESYFLKRKQLSLMLMVVDARHKPSSDDIDMIEFARYVNIEVVVIANKIDKLNKQESIKNLKMIKDTLQIREESLIPFSCLTKYNVELVLKLIDQWAHK